MSQADESHQPGKTWVVCQDEDGSLNITVVLGFGKNKSNTNILSQIILIFLRLSIGFSNFKFYSSFVRVSLLHFIALHQITLHHHQCFQF